MKKASRLIKRYIALILVLLFSIESFAAVVGDNDGAAFITKAEFDSMKNDFQSQLDRYNSSLDNKIDGAIASYLAGVGIEKRTLIKNAISNYALLRFYNDFKFWGRVWKIDTSRKFLDCTIIANSFLRNGYNYCFQMFLGKWKSHTRMVKPSEKFR